MKYNLGKQTESGVKFIEKFVGRQDQNIVEPLQPKYGIS